MNNKGVGAILCLVAALLTCTKYISAAIFMSGVASWDAELFKAGLSYIGPSLTIAAAVALFAGVFFLIFGFLTDTKK